MSADPRRVPARIWACLALGAMWLCFFAPAIFTSSVPFERDLLETELPMRYYLRQRLAAGQLPQWYPGEMMGVPYAGTVIASAFHPRTLLFLFMGAVTATKWSLLLGYLAGLIGAYRLARVFGASRLGSLAGAAVCALSGCAVSYGNKANMLLGLVAAPWMLAAVWRLTRRERLRDVVGLGVSWALIFLGGDPQIFMECGLVAIALLLTGGRRWPVWLRFVMGAALAAALAGPELLPSLGLGGDSVRSYWKETRSLAHMWALHPLRLAELVLPGFFPDDPVRMRMGQVLETRPELFVEWVFVGGAAVALAVLGLFRSWQARWVWLSTAVLGLWLATGIHGGLLEVWWKIFPFFDKFRYPEKYVGIVVVALAPLTAAGVDAARELHRQAARPLLLAGAAVFLGGILVPAASLTRWLLGAADVHEQLAPDVLSALERAWSSGFIRTGGVLIAVALVVWNLGRFPKAVALLPLLVFLELWSANGDHMPLVRKDLAEDLGPIASKLASLRPEHEPVPRVEPAWIGLNDAHRPPEEQVRLSHLSLDADDGARAGIEMMEPNGPGETWRLMRTFYNPKALGDAEVDVWRRRMSTCYRVATNGRPPRSGEEVLTPAFDEGMTLVRQPCMPRAYLSRTEPVVDHPEAVRRMRSGLPEDLAVWEGGPAVNSSAGSVTWVTGDPERLVLHVEVPETTALVVAETYAAGWSATIDGQTTPIYPTDGVARGISVPPGAHEIVMIYRAPGLIPGLLLTVLGLLASAALWWWPPPGERKRPGAETVPARGAAQSRREARV
jgi:hypothetical protein